jgi:Flp pilus assembly protein TadD
MKFLGGLLAAVLAFGGASVPATVNAAGSIDESTPIDPDFAAAVKAVEAKQWDQAMTLLTRALGRDAKNADIENYLGYTERHRGNMDAAFKHYEKALALNPKHRGAHEYVGEAYLLTGNLKKAEEHLSALDKLCFFPCSEYTELKEKVAEYKKKHQANAS